MCSTHWEDVDNGGAAEDVVLIGVSLPPQKYRKLESLLHAETEPLDGHEMCTLGRKQPENTSEASHAVTVPLTIPMAPPISPITEGSQVTASAIINTPSRYYAATTHSETLSERANVSPSVPKAPQTHAASLCINLPQVSTLPLGSLDAPTVLDSAACTPSLDSSSAVGATACHNLETNETRANEDEKLHSKQSKDVNRENLDLRSHIVEYLKNVFDRYETLGDVWRANSLRKSINTISGISDPITATNYVKLRTLPGIGASTFRKIENFVKSETALFPAVPVEDERATCLALFQRIWGIGFKTALRFYNIGIRNLDALEKQKDTLLTAPQRVGLKYIDELDKKMDSSEVKHISQCVQRVIQEAPFSSVISDCIACGSFRRGKSHCGDIDILLIKRRSGTVGLLSKVVARLHYIGLLTDDLQKTVKNVASKAQQVEHSIESKGHSSSDELDSAAEFSDEGGIQRTEIQAQRSSIYLPESYFGICIDPRNPVSGIHRRIDIKLYPESMKAYALLYFTGSSLFNRGIRMWAKKKGFHLDDRGLRLYVRVDKTSKWKGESIPCESEWDIFQTLGLKYRPPEDRESF